MIFSHQCIKAQYVPVCFLELNVLFYYDYVYINIYHATSFTSAYNIAPCCRGMLQYKKLNIRKCAFWLLNFKAFNRLDQKALVSKEISFQAYQRLEKRSSSFLSKKVWFQDNLRIFDIASVFFSRLGCLGIVNAVVYVCMLTNVVSSQEKFNQTF